MKDVGKSRVSRKIGKTKGDGGGLVIEGEERVRGE